MALLTIQGRPSPVAWGFKKVRREMNKWQVAFCCCVSCIVGFLVGNRYGKFYGILMAVLWLNRPNRVKTEVFNMVQRIIDWEKNQ